jgi:hypothetical protein
MGKLEQPYGNSTTEPRTRGALRSWEEGPLTETFIPAWEACERRNPRVT